MTAPAYYPFYIPPAGHTQPSYVTDDLHYRMRPNVDSVLSRDYSQYGPLSWSWTDFTRQTRHRTASCSGRDHYGLRASPQPQPVYNKYLTSYTDRGDINSGRRGMSTFRRMRTRA